MPILLRGHVPVPIFELNPKKKRFWQLMVHPSGMQFLSLAIAHGAAGTQASTQQGSVSR